MQISSVAKKRDGLKNVEKKMSERFIAPFLVGPLTFLSRDVGTGGGAVHCSGTEGEIDPLDFDSSAN